MNVIKIVKTTVNHHEDIFNVMKSLNNWFDENALRNIPIDLQYHRGFTAVDKKEVIGFVTYFVYEGVGNIGWIGVLEKYHNQKIGSLLLSSLEEALKQGGIDCIQVYTLSDTVEYEPYNATRAFYYNKGFKEYRRIKTGNKNCPEELYLRKKLY